MSKRQLNADVTVEVQGMVYTLRLDINAMCAIEEAESTPDRRVRFQEIAARLNVAKGQEDRIEFRSLRLLIWGLLQCHHPAMTLRQAGDLLNNLDETQAARVMREIAGDTSPDPEDVAALGGGRPNPPPPARAKATRPGGTGTRSTGRPGGSGSTGSRSGT